jgi:hypothetical protein
MSDNEIVQLPTREQIAEAIAVEWGLGRMSGPVLLKQADAVLALFPQPTPSPEPCICNTGPDTDGPDIECPVHGMPPNIEEMAPGTTFWATVDGKRELCMRANHGDVYGVTTDQWVHLNGDLDPSTIRDVTPPPATPEEGDR